MTLRSAKAVRGALLVLALVSGACAAKAEVATPTGMPALAPPTPPARVIVPAPEVPTLPVEPAMTAPPAVPATQSGTTARATPPPARSTPPPASTETSPPVVLSTVVSADFEKRIRTQLGRAEADLARVNRQALSTEARAQYDAARGFIRQCEEALKVRNLVFAGQLADKAATMAGLLRR